MTDQLFEIATRNKIRFSTPRGNLSVEDLWDLSRGDLDTLYRGLAETNKVANEEGLIKTKPTSAQKALSISLELVKRIFEVKEEERAERAAAAERREKREKIMSLIEKKKDEGLQALDVAELQKQLDALEV